MIDNICKGITLRESLQVLLHFLYDVFAEEADRVGHIGTEW